MAQRKITINLPGSPEALKDLIVFLLQRGLISEKEAYNIEQKKTSPASKKKGHWAQVAEEMSQQGYFDGRGEEVIKNIREFRDGFEIRDPFTRIDK
jgi:hypothetical protein